MKRHTLPLAVLFLLTLLAPLAGASEAPLQDDLDAPLVEWFHGEGEHDALEALEERSSAGEVRLLHWRLNADQTGSDFPNDDARLRADALGIVDGPAVAVNGRVLPDLDQATLESALNEAEYRRVLAFEGTVSMVEADGEAAVLIRGTVRPLENLSEHVIVLVTLTEDGAVDRHGRTATHLVRDMRPEVAFARDVGNSSDVLWTMTPDHLEAAGVDLSAQSLGYRLRHRRRARHRASVPHAVAPESILKHGPRHRARRASTHLRGAGRVGPCASWGNENRPSPSLHRRRALER